MELEQENHQEINETPVETTTDEQAGEEQSFDPSAFSSVDEEQPQDEAQETSALAEAQSTEEEVQEEETVGEPEPEATEVEAEATDEVSDNEGETETEEDITDWSLDSEADEDVKEEIDDEELPSLEEDLDEVEAEAEQELEIPEETWELVAEKLGLEADDVDDLVEQITKVVSTATVQDDTTSNINNLLKLGDEDLMKKELEAQGFSSEEIEDEMFAIVEGKQLKREARRVRRELQGALTQHKQQAIAMQEQEETQRANLIQDNRKKLWKHLSKTDNMLGGKINRKQQEDHYKYIASGTFEDEIASSHEAMAQAAWLWRYRDQIVKNMKRNGFERGKKHVLDTLTNPDLGKNTPVPEPETGSFNPERFMFDNQGGM